jgi:CheY-like chemotaxis protein
LAQRIVIVDDTALNRRVLESLIRELDDVEVLSFASSPEERAPSLGASLFIIDYQMPTPNGMELLSAIRADERVRHAATSSRRWLKGSKRNRKPRSCYLRAARSVRASFTGDRCRRTISRRSA